MKSDLAAVAPGERRIVLVASDGTYARLAAAIDPQVLLPMALAFFAGGPLTIGALAAATLWKTRKKSDRPFPERLASIVQKGELPVPHVAPADATKLFRFEGNHPHDGAAYVLHPWDERRYLVPATAPARLAEERVAAFIELASALGAKRVTLVSAEVRKKGRRLGGSSPLPKVAAQLGLSHALKSHLEARQRAFVELDEPTREPHVPAHLEPLLAVDPVLRSLATTRIDGAPRTMRVSLTFGQDQSTFRGLGLTLAKYGVDVGGTIEEIAESNWDFEVEFWPKPR